MNSSRPLSRRLTAILVYGRTPLVFGGMICALAVMWTQNPFFYALGVFFLFTSMMFDLIDGWFAARFRPNPVLAQLADRIMDKVVYSIIFPLIAVGMMWRLMFVAATPRRLELLHAILVLILCILVLIRDNFAHFMRGFALRQHQEPEPSEFTRLRTIVAAPLAALLYAYAFNMPTWQNSPFYFWAAWLDKIPFRVWFFIEILFLVINFGSIAGYCRKYGKYCLDELCFGDDKLRRGILSIFPNAMTVMNAMMGLFSVFFAYQGRFRETYLILMGAAIFDKLDGALARKLGLAETGSQSGQAHQISLGALLDDIADAVSFCIAPAWIAYICLSGIDDPIVKRLPIGIVCICYTAFGMLRLIYFTLDKNPIPGFFKGIPTPAAALLVAAPLMMLHHAAEIGSQDVVAWACFSFGLLLFTAVLMNCYFIRYIHFGRYMDSHPWFTRINLMFILSSVLTPYFGFVVLIEMLIYVLSPLVTWRIDTDALKGVQKA